MMMIQTSNELREWSSCPAETRGPARVPDGRRLYDLTSVTSLAGLTLGDGCELYDLPDDVDLSSVHVTENEARILDQIPVDRCNMGTWHGQDHGCGTTHCLAGWAQVLAGRMDESPLDVGQQLLPSLSHLFFAPTVAIRRYLAARQYLPVRD